MKKRKKRKMRKKTLPLPLTNETTYVIINIAIPMTCQGDRMRSTEFTCDVCGERKTPLNGWTMALVTRSGHVMFKRWDPTSHSKKVKHLCRPECETKFLLQNTGSWRTESESRGESRGELIKHVGPEPFTPVKIDPFTPVLPQEETVTQ
jgi:hypothetical protein